MKKSAEERFWSKVDNTGGPIHPVLGTRCWVWAGGLRRGYGTVVIGSLRKYAHRASWELTNGDIPEGLCVLHRCDNPPCCNPAHLFLGTVQENNADRVAKGRGRGAIGEANGSRTRPDRLARGDAHPARMHPECLARGENHGHAKLTEAAVREIRKARIAGVPQRELALRFGVSRPCISLIESRRNWSHVQDEGGA